MFTSRVGLDRAEQLYTNFLTLSAEYRRSAFRLYVRDWYLRSEIHQYGAPFPQICLNVGLSWMEPLSCRDCVENNASVLPNNGITDEPQVGGEALQGNYWIAFCHENFVPRFSPPAIRGSLLSQRAILLRYYYLYNACPLGMSPPSVRMYTDTFNAAE